MSDQLTAEERRAIDEAIARGAVQVIPRGKSSLPELAYCSVTRQILDADMVALKPSERKAAAVKKKKVHGQIKRPIPRAKKEPIRRATPPHVVERREKVGAMIRAGKTSAQIHEATGAPMHLIWNDAKLLGLTLVRGQRPDVVELQARLRAYAAQGMTPVQMAAAENAPGSRIWHHLKVLGFRFPRGSKK